MPCSIRFVAVRPNTGTRVVLAMGGAEFSYGSSLATHSIAGTFCAAAAAKRRLDLELCDVGDDADRQRLAPVAHRDLVARERRHVDAGP